VSKVLEKRNKIRYCKVALHIISYYTIKFDIILIAYHIDANNSSICPRIWGLKKLHISLVLSYVFGLLDVVAQPDLVAQRLGAFHVFPVDGEQGLKARFAAAGLYLYELIVLVAPRGTQANVVLFLLPQPGSPSPPFPPGG
jgi:hypothetical protein